MMSPRYPSSSTHFRAAAERVYQAIFQDAFYEARQAGQKEVADVLSRVFHHSMVERIEAALRGEEDPLRRVVNEARARKEPAK